MKYPTLRFYKYNERLITDNESFVFTQFNYNFNYIKFATFKLSKHLQLIKALTYETELMYKIFDDLH